MERSSDGAGCTNPEQEKATPSGAAPGLRPCPPAMLDCLKLTRSLCGPQDSKTAQKYLNLGIFVP